jgi:hypothetical protein
VTRSPVAAGLGVGLQALALLVAPLSVVQPARARGARRAAILGASGPVRDVLRARGGEPVEHDVGGVRQRGE